MRAVWLLAIAAALAGASARPVAAQQPHQVIIHTRHYARPLLVYHISERQARALALTQMRRGFVRSVHMGRRFGRPVYIYTITRPGLRGYRLVTIDGISGRVLSSSFVRT